MVLQIWLILVQYTPVKLQNAARTRLLLADDLVYMWVKVSRVLGFLMASLWIDYLDPAGSHRGNPMVWEKSKVM